MNDLEFFIPGLPKPQGRPRAFSRGKFIKVYSPQTEWRCNCTKMSADLLALYGQFNEAICVSIEYYFQRPSSHYGTGKNRDQLKKSAPKYHIKKPDNDNLNKAVLDAFGDAGLIKNDSQVVNLISRKVYTTGQQGALVKIQKMEAGDK